MDFVKKAVFPVAGFGTRFLPATKAMPKELLPIVDKPLIQYAAEEAIEAGIETLIFVTGRNKRAIEDHFDNNPELEWALRAKGKVAQADMVKNILPDNIECIFVRQTEQLGLGHAIMCAERVIGDEPFAVLLADDFMISEEKSPIFDLVYSYNKSKKMQISVMEVNGPEISKYGVVTLEKNQKKVTSIIEKPKFEEALSNLASIGRYVLTPKIFEILKNLKPDKVGEIQLADALAIGAKENAVEAVKFGGKRFDCGSVSGFVDANRHVADKKSINN